jgi:uncharacterized protein YoxC
MKKLLSVAILLMAVAMLLAGCGKSADMKKLEANLNTEVMQKHDDLMKQMSGLDGLADQIAALTAKQDSLAKLFPKQFAGLQSTDLLAAKEKLQAAKSAMTAWMKNFKPYDPELKHEVVMESLAKTKGDLDVIEKQFAEATTVAKDLVAKQSTMIDDLAAKLPKRK